MKLSEYIDGLEAKGQCWFLRKDALVVLGCNALALDEAIKRLIQKKRLVLIRSGFIVIIPNTYKNKGIIPADWFIDPLMAFLQIPYYIALLTAANFYGAAHQKPQIFQVMVDRNLRKITKSILRIEFYKKNDLKDTLTQKIQVTTGYAKIATQEETALDLVRYFRAGGYFSNVATVLSELKDSLDPDKLLQLIDSGKYDWSVLQRFGYLMSLEAVGGKDLVVPLKKLIESQKPKMTVLQPGQAYHKKQKNAEWRLWINEEVEVDI